MIKEVSRAELRARTAAGEAILVLDVRSAEEFAAGHIEGAIHVPVADIAADATRIPHDRPIVTACGKGGGRSKGAAVALAEAGAVDVGYLEGGTLGWLADTQAPGGDHGEESVHPE